MGVIYGCNGKARRTLSALVARAYLLLVTTWIYKISSCADSRWMTFFVINDKILVCGQQTTSVLEQENMRMCATSDSNVDKNHENDYEDEKRHLLVLMLQRLRRRLSAARGQQ